MLSQEMEGFLSNVKIPLRLGSRAKLDYPVVISLMFLYNDNRFFCATQNTAKIVGYIKKDSRCGFEIAGDSYPYRGVRGYGHALINVEEGENVLRRLLQKYFEGKENSQLHKYLLSKSHLKNEVSIEIKPIKMFEWDYSDRMDDLK